MQSPRAIALARGWGEGVGGSLFCFMFLGVMLTYSLMDLFPDDSRVAPSANLLFTHHLCYRVLKIVLLINNNKIIIIIILRGSVYPDKPTEDHQELISAQSTRDVKVDRPRRQTRH